MSFKMKWNHAFEPALERKVNDIVASIGDIIVAEAQKNLSGSGRSSPGNFPGMQTGRLRRSIHWNQIDRGSLVISGLGYGAILETSLNRPWLRRSIKMAQPAINAMIASNRL